MHEARDGPEGQAGGYSGVGVGSVSRQVTVTREGQRERSDEFD